MSPSPRPKLMHWGQGLVPRLDDREGREDQLAQVHRNAIEEALDPPLLHLDPPRVVGGVLPEDQRHGVGRLISPHTVDVDLERFIAALRNPRSGRIAIATRRSRSASRLNSARGAIEGHRDPLWRLTPDIRYRPGDDPASLSRDEVREGRPGRREKHECED